MDDIQNPSIEGPESFVIFLSSPQGAVLQEPYEASIVITDTFQDSMYSTWTIHIVLLHFNSLLEPALYENSSS